MHCKLTYTEAAWIPQVRLPLSKSLGARLLALCAATGTDPDCLRLPADGLCDDLRVMLGAARLIAENSENSELRLGESATALRMLTAVCAFRPGKWLLVPGNRLSNRPIESFIKELNALGANVRRQADGSISIEGMPFPDMAERAAHDVSLSSQGCSGLMIAAAASGGKRLRLQLSENAVSTPYIEMTAALLRQCGGMAWYDPARGTVDVTGTPAIEPDTELLEADWSAAAFMYLYTLLSGRSLFIEGLCDPATSLQGDARIAEIFALIGVKTVVQTNGILLEAGERQEDALDLDMRDMPDAVPAVAVGCALVRMPMRLRGVGRLRHKESDRLEAIAAGLGLFGAMVRVEADELVFKPSRALHAPFDPIHTCGDHRIAMAFAPTACRFHGVRLDDAGCISKSFPDFLNQMSRGGITTS